MENGREQRGMAIAAVCKLSEERLGVWTVPSQTVIGKRYKVTYFRETAKCTCPDFETHQSDCKHIFAVRYTIQRETHPDGTTTVTQTTRVTYSQNWANYNAAQTTEKTAVAALLKALCTGIQQGPQRRGRPRLPLSDVTFGAIMKVYTTFSGRRATSELRDCEMKGQIDGTPHYNSIFNYLGNEALTPILKALIEESAAPLRAIETDFAVDSSGFSTCMFERWYDERYGTLQSKHQWLKVHLMTGVKTNVITALSVSSHLLLTSLY